MIRPFFDDDVADLGSVHGHDRDEPRRARTFVAEDDGEVVGAATLMWSTRHPDLVAATIDVAAPARRCGIGTALLARLENEADRPVVFNVEQSTEATEFLKSAGFDAAVTSVTSRVDVAEVIKLLEPRFDPNASSVSVIATDELDASVIALYERIYAERHRWAGRYTPPTDAPWIRFAGDVLHEPGAIQVAIRDGEPIGVASLHRGHFADGADAFVPPTSTLSGSHEERVSILGRLLHAVLQAGLDVGINSVNLEYDSTYDDLTAVMEPWPTTDRAVRHAWLRGTHSRTDVGVHV